LNRFLRGALGAAALASLLSGCGSSAEPSKTGAGAAVPGPNRRFLANEKLRDLIGKDGKPVWTPGKPMVPPAGRPNQ
jgi:hypothetical protein